MANQVYIKKDKLKTITENDFDFLYSYFNGFNIECFDSGNCYQVNLDAEQYIYCEDLSEGLNFLGIDFPKIKDYCVIKNNCALCLSENWLPYAFCKLTQGIIKKQNLSIIHVDDHSDLMAPYIGYVNGVVMNMITRELVDFNDSESIKRAILSGAITIGSMLTSIVYPLEKFKIFHVKQGAERKMFTIKKSSFTDNIIIDKCERICIDVNSVQESKNYLITQNWDDVVNSISENEKCLLHIDMDYFNNRYNASTSWYKENKRHDPTFRQQMLVMDRLFSSVKKINEKAKILNVLIGISPSFYPQEYWAMGLQYLVDGFERIGFKIGVLLENCNMEAYDAHQ